ncbi:hypothetical protein CONLIGDRAFT_330695 [Coniochaeta ligniaria NRRL 30616]|uniref:Uncharacterized protein n=1 Tax=Coniochaeta ligniaria NRRL 30616 TaxID=1408157 RepID=A0A1J7IQ48_9PEZI|nr:hypothetical protein CONLIGDRAFT_330695 [Coniochaeta ligniaria NRRL 30616]
MAKDLARGHRICRSPTPATNQRNLNRPPNPYSAWCHLTFSEPPVCGEKPKVKKRLGRRCDFRPLGWDHLSPATCTKSIDLLDHHGRTLMRSDMVCALTARYLHTNGDYCWFLVLFSTHTYEFEVVVLTDTRTTWLQAIIGPRLLVLQPSVSSTKICYIIRLKANLVISLGREVSDVCWSLASCDTVLSPTKALNHSR